jgi:hypothetical protein
MFVPSTQEPQKNFIRRITGGRQAVRFEVHRKEALRWNSFSTF